MSNSEFNIGLGIDIVVDNEIDARLKKKIIEIQSKAQKIGNIDVTLGIDGKVSKAVVAFTDNIGRAAKQIIELDKAEQKLITTQEIYSKNISKESNAAYSKIISSMKEINFLKIKKLTADEQEAIALGKTLKLEQERLRRYKAQLAGNSELKDLEKQNEVKKLQVDLEHKYNQAKAKNIDKNNETYLKQIQKETAALQAQANLINKMYDKNQYKHENLNTNIGNALAGDLSVQDEKSLLALKHGLSEIDLASDKAEQQIREFDAAFKQLKTDIGNGKLIESNSTDIGVKSSKAEIAEYIAALKDVEASQVKVGEIGRTTFDSLDRAVNKVTAEIHNADGSVDKLDLSFKSLGKGETEIRALDKGLKDTNSSVNSLGKNVMKLVGYFISFSIVVGKIREALNVMRDVDAQLVVIQKVTDASNESMKALAKSAYSVGSEFGKSADKYLSAVAAFSRAGYKETAEELSKLSLLTQNAGDVSQEKANKYLIAADAAWKLGGNAKELSKILDGMNEIKHCLLAQ